MNILFLSLGRCWSINDQEMYTSLLRCFIKDGDNVYILSPIERREKKKAQIIREGNSTIVKINILNIQKTNIIEKGISTLSIETLFLKALKKELNGIRFDLVLYPTPPITFYKVVQYVKKRDNAKTYLMLKDIFPQNAVDIGMMTKKGVKSVIYKYFRRKEKKLYALSDKIGCMSQANVDYVLKHNPEIAKEKVEICPNSIEVKPVRISKEEKAAIRGKYNIPGDRRVFVYGGNFGKPQGIPFIIECLKAQKNNDKVFFLLVGDGTEYKRLEAYINEAKQSNAMLMKRLPKEDYNTVVAACDVGLIFLDYRFTIPNYPSRLLSYMQAYLPVLACTDRNTDVGKTIVSGKFGWWAESNSPADFSKRVEEALNSDLISLGENAYEYLCRNYSVEVSHNAIKGFICNS